MGRGNVRKGVVDPGLHVFHIVVHPTDYYIIVKIYIHFTTLKTLVATFRYEKVMCRCTIHAI